MKLDGAPAETRGIVEEVDDNVGAAIDELDFQIEPARRRSEGHGPKLTCCEIRGPGGGDLGGTLVRDDDVEEWRPPSTHRCELRCKQVEGIGLMFLRLDDALLDLSQELAKGCAIT